MWCDVCEKSKKKVRRVDDVYVCTDCLKEGDEKNG